ncbi:MAG: hypothetical protein CM15mP36_11130 [Flavobacteriales bacterium]|nr:MAG: hypothetical protein CM15mP36_11130 [Flavobacteriales bacterium]
MPICHLVYFGILLTILNKLKIDTMKKGNINVSVENIFPLIKSFYTVTMKYFYVN